MRRISNHKSMFAHQESIGSGTNIELKLDQDEEKFLNLKIEGLINQDTEFTKSLLMTSIVKKKEFSDRTKITEYCMVRHDSRWKMNFDIFIILLALWNCITIPLEVSFTNMDFIKVQGYLIFGRVVDGLFAIDILVNFRTTFISEKTATEIVDGKLIAKNYVFGGRFFVDLLASIPFDLLIVTES